MLLGLFGFLFFIGMPVATIYLLTCNRRLNAEVEGLNKRLGLLETGAQLKPAATSAESAANVTPPAFTPAEEPTETAVEELEAYATALAQPEPGGSEVAAGHFEAEPEKPTAYADDRSDWAARASVTQQAAQAVEPSLFSKLITGVIDKVKAYFTEGNLIVRVGVIVLFFGVAFLLRYAAERSVFPIELRIACVGLIGMVILLIGWMQRHKRRIYALVMQGGGVGILYMTAFASARFYQLLPAGLVFALMVVMVVMGAMLAILQNARALAILALTGGFMAPVLTSTGEGSHIMLFSYFAVLNVGVVLIAFYKHWRLLNLVGFAFTFVLSSLWGFTSYSFEHYLSCQLFLILFFLFYAAIGSLFARDFTASGIRAVGYVDGTLVFGLPLVAFSIQVALVQDIKFGLAWSALAAGVFYLLLTRILWLRLGQRLRLLLESYLALGVVFTTLVIPFALEGEWITTAWALEGAAVLWVSLRQSRNLGAIFAIGLQFLAGAAFFTSAESSQSPLVFLNSHSLSSLLVAFSGLYSAYLLYDQFIRPQKLQSWHGKLSLPLLLWGLLWWFVNGAVELLDNYMFDGLSLLLVFVVASVVAMLALAKRLSWHHMRYGLYGLFAVVPVFTVFTLLLNRQPFNDGFWLAWPIAWATGYAALYWWEHYQASWFERESALSTPGASRLWPGFHTVNLVSVVVITGKFIHWLFESRFVGLGEAWSLALSMLPAIAATLAILRIHRWPFSVAANAYRRVAIVPLLAGLALWSLLMVGNPGDVGPLPYIPLLNIVDITQAIVFICLLSWWHAERKAALLVRDQSSRVWFYSFAGGLGFIWLNAVLLRTLHHYFGIDYQPDALFNSASVQASLSVLWALAGLVLMVAASRKQWRRLWLVAAALLGVVVVKLFLVDMADTDTLASIISFILVGSLLLVIGFVSPIPPRAAATQPQAPEQEAV
ncbi:putative membrane protein [Reinekea marinisedimentorum]|uniref:Putative membrane protein n=1 Tax=Reinekea marinisedimentorum TaxID=230495 RepID=A0A4R3IAT8_9GAMM|nr:putative membrane protein [Reinekea marinisedimentorum]